MATASRSWILQYTLVIPLFVLPEILIVGRILLNIPVAKLLGPMVSFSLLFLLSAPFVYWARNRACEKRDLGALIVVVGVLGVLFCLLLAFYGVQLGVLAPGTARNFSAVTVIVLLPESVLGYFAAKKVWASK